MKKMNNCATLETLIRNEADMEKLVKYAEKVGIVQTSESGTFGYIPDELLEGFFEYRDTMEKEEEAEALWDAMKDLCFQRLYNK